jgi:UDP-N-acetylglucosamine--N-acetylmuramyl-(pentapeptide) pyrophosphoryl-undecaprenol N-acetylglucosamine transferase
MRVILTGGGTGGHLFPALAVADALKRDDPSIDILFVGASTGLEASAVPQAGYPFEGLPAIGLPRRLGPRLFRAGIAGIRSVFRARDIIREWKPDVIFATGGFAAAPVLVASRMLHIPIVLHEQNSVPGITNRFGSRFAREVHLTYSSARRYFPRRDHLRLTGMPIRDIVQQGSRGKGLRAFRLDEDRKTVLVFGGSQGAHKINQAIVEALPAFAGRKDVQFVIQTGQKDYDEVLEACRVVDVRTWVRPFIVNMGDAYAVSDLVVCRAGALTLAELAAAGKPAILIPFPFATANHQALNAEVFAEAGGAIVIPDGDLKGDLLEKRIMELIDNPRRLRLMAIQAVQLARPDATDRLEAAIRRFGGVGEGLEPEPQPQPRPPGPRRPEQGPQGPQGPRGPRGGGRSQAPRGGPVAHQGS